MKLKLFGAVLAMCIPSAPVYANTLLPGTTGASPDVLSLAGLTLDGSGTAALDSLTFTASVNYAVYTGGLCPTCITFAYQVTDNGAGTESGSTGVIEDLTAFSYSGFTTDVGYDNLTTVSGAFTTGGENPDTVGRSESGSGAVVTFDYPSSASAQLVPGDHTSVLIVETNSNTYTSGLFSAIDGATATAAAFAPLNVSVTGTPEPETMGLVGFGLLGLGFISRRLKS
jgi:hypothetical protein